MRSPRKEVYSQFTASTSNSTHSNKDDKSIASQWEEQSDYTQRLVLYLCATRLNVTALHLLGFLIVPISVAMVTSLSCKEIYLKLPQDSPFMHIVTYTSCLKPVSLFI